MSLSLIFIAVMTFSWCLVVGAFTLGQALLGLGFGTVFVLLTGAGQGRRVPLRELPSRLLYATVYLLVLIPYDIVRSNLDMAWRLVRRRPLLRPGIVRVRLGPVSEATSALVAHAITMSPGEVVVDYAEDQQTLYVHLIDVTDADSRRAAFWRTYRRVLQRVFS